MAELVNIKLPWESLGDLVDDCMGLGYPDIIVDTLTQDGIRASYKPVPKCWESSPYKVWFHPCYDESTYSYEYISFDCASEEIAVMLQLRYT